MSDIKSVLSWPTKALSSIGLLYQDLQDITVYVEDKNSEAFYLELLNRLIEKDYVIKKVIPLEGRENVTRHCKKTTNHKRKLFIIDGDLDLLLDSREKGLTNLFQHNVYCIENYLFCKDATRELIVESSGKLLRDDILADTEWEVFLSELSPLLDLFVYLSTARKLCPTLKNVSHGFHSVSTKSEKRKRPKIDGEKIENLKEEIKTECISRVGEDNWERMLIRVYSNQGAYDFTDIVSGKDFLLPALLHFSKNQGLDATVKKESFMFRLSKYCNLDKLNKLKDCLNSVANGKDFISS
jgi:hypothetical protein